MAKKKLPPIDDEWMSLPDATRYTGKSRYHMTELAKGAEDMGLSKKEKYGESRVRWSLSRTLLYMAKKFGLWGVVIWVIYKVVKNVL